MGNTVGITFLNWSVHMKLLVLIVIFLNSVAAMAGDLVKTANGVVEGAGCSRRGFVFLEEFRLPAADG
jgi:hypothetical protein